MATVSTSRKIGRAGVNALRTLLEEHDHLVQEIGEGADHGEDLYVGFVVGGRRTGHVIAVQVKSGEKYKRAKGYAIPVADHRQDWRESRLPVVGIVYDRDQKRLFWVNLTQELQRGSEATWVQVPRHNELTESSLDGFVSEMQAYIDMQGTPVAGDAEGVTQVADAAIKTPAADAGRLPFGFNRVVGVSGILLTVVFTSIMTGSFLAVVEPTLRVTEDNLEFAIGGPLTGVLSCLIGSAMAMFDPRNVWAQISRALGVGIVCWIDYLVFRHHQLLDSVAGWSLLAVAIIAETLAFVCTPQIGYRFAMIIRGAPGRSDPA